MSRYLEAVSIKVVRESRIESVTVHARGAVVKRRASLGELPDSACDVVLDGVTSLAETGTLRASIDGAREVLGVRAELVVPDKPGDDGSLRAKLAEVRRAREDLVAARSHAEWRKSCSRRCSRIRSCGARPGSIPPSASPTPSLS
ncbi:MAG: DUF4140 domain-containing protein [Polyangiaceae bacterium]